MKKLTVEYWNCFFWKRHKKFGQTNLDEPFLIYTTVKLTSKSSCFYQTYLLKMMAQKPHVLTFHLKIEIGMNQEKFKNEPRKICGSPPLKNLKWYGLLQVDHTPSNF